MAQQTTQHPETSGRVHVSSNQRVGSDFMVDVIKTLGIDYIAANPGSSFRSLQESFINYGGNKDPEWLTCCHEESSVAMAHGYAKIEGKPMMIMAHGTVGLQHASMAIYNAYCRAMKPSRLVAMRTDSFISTSNETMRFPPKGPTTSLRHIPSGAPSCGRSRTERWQSPREPAPAATGERLARHARRSW